MANLQVPKDWPPPNYNHPKTRGNPALFAVTSTATAIVVALRMFSRLRLTKSMGLDDALLLIGFILSIGQTFAECKALTTWGWNKHVWDIPPDRLQKVRLAAWLIQCFFLLGNSCTKVSILLFYRRVSSRSHRVWFIRLTWAALAFTVMYTVGLGLELVFVCRPFVSYWRSYDPTYTTKFTCGNEQIPILFSAAASISSDFYASILPMLLVRQLKMTSRQRLGLYLLFSAGMLTGFIGFARLAFLIKVTTNYLPGPNMGDPSWYGWPLFGLTDVEAHLAMVCASLPALKAFFQRKKPRPKISAPFVSMDSYRSFSPIFPTPPYSHFLLTMPTSKSSVPSPALRPGGGLAQDVSHIEQNMTGGIRYPRRAFGLRKPSTKPVPLKAEEKYNCKCSLCASIDGLDKNLVIRRP